MMHTSSMQVEKGTPAVLIGTTDLPELKKGAAFIDKSSFIQRVVNDGSQLLLFTRPRRFMKTSNLRTLHYFFSKEVENRPTAGLFDDMKIKDLKDYYGNDLISTHQGRYPVIWLSFKDINGSNFEEIFDCFKVLISKTYSQYLESIMKDLTEWEQAYVNEIISQSATKANLNLSLKNLTEILRSHHPQNEQVILLIDEYDHPISHAYAQDSSSNLVQEVIELITNILNPVLKDNLHLERAILTGIGSISFDSFFLKSSSLLDPLRYCDAFGFTEKEVKSLLERLESPLSFQDIKQLYNGYLIDNCEIYNPWSILNAIKDKKLGYYWVTTGSVTVIENILKDMLEINISMLRNLFENPTQVELYDEFPYTKKSKDMNYIYHLLWFAGYLKPASLILKFCSRYEFQAKLVNEEVFEYFSSILLSLLASIFHWTRSDWIPCLKCLEVEPPNVQGFVQNLKENILIRYNDDNNSTSKCKVSTKIKATKEIAINEIFYQGLMLGFFLCMSAEYDVISTDETGLGCSDYLIKHKSNKQKMGICCRI